MLLRKIDATDSVERCSGSGRPRTVRVPDVIANVQDLVLSQENAPKTHSSQRRISRRTRVSLGSVNRIIRNDLRLMSTCLKRCRAHELTDANKIARRERCRNLLKRYSAGLVNFIWFTDKKNFSVTTPRNHSKRPSVRSVWSPQKNVAAYRLLRTRPTFSKCVMVSVGVSALGKTSLHFVDPGTKIDGKYYRDVLLMRGLLPDIRSYSEYFTFQQDGAPAHRARESVDMLRQEKRRTSFRPHYGRPTVLT